MDIQKLYKIGEASKKLGLPIESLRSYERDGLIEPLRVRGTRLYNDEILQKFLDNIKTDKTKQNKISREL